MNRLLSSIFLWALPVLALAQAVPPAMPAPTTNLPPPMPAPTTNLPPPAAAPTPLVVPVAPMHLTASQTFVSRGSTATYFDSTGTLQTAPANTPRYDYDPITHVAKGILVEPRRTNFVQNSIFQGASVGNNPGTTWTFGSYGSLSMEVVGKGVEDGISYLDVRVYGTNTNSTTGVFPQLDMSPKISCRAGQIWTVSRYATLVGGSANGIAYVYMSLPMKTSKNEYLSSATLASSSLITGKLSQNFKSSTGQITGSLSTRCGAVLGVAVPPNTTVDTTIRFGAPQLEMGNNATSYIPTNGTPVTRVQDVYQQF
jgi:hypothetical protein